MPLAHDQGSRATQSDMESGFIRVIPSYKTVGTGEEVYGRLLPLQVLVALNCLEVRTKSWDRKLDTKGARGRTNDSKSDSHHL